MIQERFESELEQWIIFIITALLIGFLVGLVILALGNIFRESPYTANIEIIIAALVAIAVVTYLSFIFMIRPAHLSSDVSCRLLYNIITGDFLGPSVFLSYYLAQEAIEQTVRRSSMYDNRLKGQIRNEILDSDLDGEVLSQLLEYLIIRWLNRSFSTIFIFGGREIRTLNFKAYPGWLKNNYFVHAFSVSPSVDRLDAELGDLEVNIPNMFNLVSYIPGRNVNIEGKEAKIAITYFVYSFWPPQYIDHRIPSISDIPINSNSQKELTDQLPNLRLINVIFSFNADLPRWRSLFRRKKFVFYLNWCSKLQKDFESFFNPYPE